MRGAHPNLVYVPASKDKKGREKPAHYMTDLTINYRRVRRFAGFTKEEALIYLGELRKAAKEGRLDELIRPAKALPGRRLESMPRPSLTLPNGSRSGVTAGTKPRSTPSTEFSRTFRLPI